MDKTHTMQTTQPLNLDKISQKKLEVLVSSGYLARRWGAVAMFVPPSETWTLTARGETLYHLV